MRGIPDTTLVASSWAIVRKPLARARNTVKISLGAALDSPPTAAGMGTPKSSIARADKALYSARHGGRNRSAFADD